MHRDVSAENIMLNQDGIGFLNDWDHGMPSLAGRVVHSARSVGQFLPMHYALLTISFDREIASLSPLHCQAIDSSLMT